MLEELELVAPAAEAEAALVVLVEMLCREVHMELVGMGDSAFKC